MKLFPAGRGGEGEKRCGEVGGVVVLLLDGRGGEGEQYFNTSSSTSTRWKFVCYADALDLQALSPFSGHRGDDRGGWIAAASSGSSWRVMESAHVAAAPK